MSIDISKVNEILKNKTPDRHSFFQLKYFLIGKEPTIQSKMWQCLKEIETRKNALENLELELEDSEENKTLLMLDLQDICDNPKSKLKENLINQLKDKIITNEIIRKEIREKKIKRQVLLLTKKIEELNEKKKYIQEELEFFIITFEKLNEIEKLRPFDDLEVQTEYWNQKLSQKFNLSILMNSKIDEELISTILALPNEAPIKKETIYKIEQEQNRLLEVKAKNEAEQVKKNLENK